MTIGQIAFVIGFSIALLFIGSRIGVLMIRRQTLNYWKNEGFKSGYERGAMVKFED